MTLNKILEEGKKIGYFHDTANIKSVTRESISEILNLRTLNTAIDNQLLPHDATILDLNMGIINKINKIS